MPGKANITLLYGDKILSNSNLQFSQFGKVMQLPSTMFDDKKKSAKAEFFPVTGGIKEIVYE